MAALKWVILDSGQAPLEALRAESLAGSDARVVALVAWQLFRPGEAWKCTVGWWAQTARSAAQYDRLNGAGKAGVLLAEAIADPAADAAIGGVIPGSIAYHLDLLRRLARASRRHDRARRGKRASAEPKGWISDDDRRRPPRRRRRRA